MLMYSATPLVAGLTMALAQARGLFDYDTPVATYWPEFAQQGKERITVRQLLAHQAGLCLIDTPLTPRLLADPNALAAVLARQKPLWEPGTRQGYHAFSLGLYENEIIRRTDPQQRSLSHFFHDELAQPLGLELYIGVPASIPDERIASIEAFGALQLVLHLPAMPLRYALGLLNPRSITARTLLNPKWTLRRIGIDRRCGRSICDLRPAWDKCAVWPGCTVSLQSGGQELGIPPATLAALMAPVCPPTGGSSDVVLKVESAYSLGFMKPHADFRCGTSEHAFGEPGAGGSQAFADPDAQVGYAYVMNRHSYAMQDDPREKALRDTFYQCLHKRQEFQGVTPTPA